MGVQTTQGYRGKLVDRLTGIILDQFADEDIRKREVSPRSLELERTFWKFNYKPT